MNFVPALGVMSRKNYSRNSKGTNDDDSTKYCFRETTWFV